MLKYKREPNLIALHIFMCGIFNDIPSPLIAFWITYDIEANL